MAQVVRLVAASLLVARVVLAAALAGTRVRACAVLAGATTAGTVLGVVAPCNTLVARAGSLVHGDAVAPANIASHHCHFL